MKNILITIFIIFSVSYFAFSQDKEFYFDENTSNKPEKEKTINENILFGAHYVVQIGPYTNINLSPEISYKVHKMLQAGLGINLSYYYAFGYNSTAIVYGGRAFARFFPIERLYIQAEAEMLSLAVKDPYLGYQFTKDFIPGTLIGIGYTQKLNSHFSFMTTFLYNITINEKTPYNNPIYRVGFIFH